MYMVFYCLFYLCTFLYLAFILYCNMSDGTYAICFFSPHFLSLIFIFGLKGFVFRPGGLDAIKKNPGGVKNTQVTYTCKSNVKHV